MKPAPKRRVLQAGPQPRLEKQINDPNGCVETSGYHRALVGDVPGATPAEAFQYDIVFEAFKNDADFWTHWSVVGCAKNSPNESISQESACIRVVMNLPSTQKLFPKVYTPGFSTLPAYVKNEKGKNGAKGQPQAIKELPLGYSVALDVHILEDARIMLDFQRSFRGGKIDPKYTWLDAIVSRVCVECNDFVFSDENKCGKCGAPRQDQQQESALALGDGRRVPSVALEVVRSEAQANLRPLVGSMSAASMGLKLDAMPQIPLRSDKLLSYTDEYIHGQNKTKTVCDEYREGDLLHPSGSGLRQVYEENALVYPFGDDVRLPPREGGKW